MMSSVDGFKMAYRIFVTIVLLICSLGCATGEKPSIGGTILFLAPIMPIWW